MDLRSTVFDALNTALDNGFDFFPETNLELVALDLVSHHQPLESAELSAIIPIINEWQNDQARQRLR